MKKMHLYRVCDFEAIVHANSTSTLVAPLDRWEGDIISRPSVVESSKFQRRSSCMGHEGTDRVGPREEQHSFGHNWFISSQGYNPGIKGS